MITIKFKILFLLSFYILHSTFSIATIRYVSHTGTSIPPYTTWETAADSIQKAINICIDGDTVIVANGVYYENLVINSTIDLIGSSIDSTVIDGRGMADYTIIFNSGGSIQNFNIYGKGLGYPATRVIRAYDFLEVRNSTLSEAGVGISIIAPYFGANGYFKINNVIIKNTIRGINAGSSTQSDTYYISNNLILLQDYNSMGISLSSAGIFYISNNLILFTETNNSSLGIYISPPREVHIYNNLISGFRDNIFIEIHIDSCNIINNVLLNSESTSIFSGNDDAIIRNNIIMNHRTGIYGWPVQSDYNLFWENNVNYHYSNYGDSDIVADPMFVKDTIPNEELDFDFHLQKYSPAIDKGNPDILDVDGTRSDIGMFGGPYGEKYTYKDFAPRTPRNASAIINNENQILLRWLRNTEADTSHYNVYRDTILNFTIDSTKLITSITDTFYVEQILPNLSRIVYKITAVDNQGNESVPTMDRVVNIVGVDEYEVVPDDYILYHNYPNPFNPSTSISYKLKERGYIKLMVYNIKGELISVLVNEEQEAGYYEVEFNVVQDSSPAIASGIYLYRIEVIGEGNIPRFSDMKKMMLIK